MCLTLWGPQPVAWLWVGSQVDYLTGSVTLGIAVAFAGMIATLMLTLAVAARLDRAVADPAPRRGPRAARGRARADLRRHRRRRRRSRSSFWFVILEGPLRAWRRSDPQAARLLPPVRGAVAGGDQPRADRAPPRRAGAGADARCRRSTSPRRPGTSRPTPRRSTPPPTRCGARSTPTRTPAPLREALAARHGVEPEQVAPGHGAGELLRAAFRGARGGRGRGRLARLGLPAAARRRGRRARPVGRSSPDVDALAAAPDAARSCVCSPNDPTGALIDVRGAGASGSPSRCG